ncbi:MAG: hypothetical protein LUE24_02980 [Lachnospiraceae bacterium]|nr:hypothetical protein [Lachnospiraceae bacterium]MCD8196123.1 hypothetical protein [Lachnospiraceae bacterium]
MEQFEDTRPLDMEDEATRNLVRSYEDDILGGLLAAAGYTDSEDEIQPITIVRNGVTLLNFRIRPLSEEEYNACSKRHTKYIRNKQIGIRIPEETDKIAYRSDLIYTATVKEDREKVWNNKAAWKKLDVLSGIELIDRVLKAGEKDMICDKIDEISGYSSSTEETAKN